MRYDTCSYNRKDIEQITHLAFQEAMKRRKKVTLVRQGKCVGHVSFMEKSCDGY